jgi:hypothetical protein
MSRRDVMTCCQVSARCDGLDRVLDVGDEHTVRVPDAEMVFFGRLVAVQDGAW